VLFLALPLFTIEEGKDEDARIFQRYWKDYEDAGMVTKMLEWLRRCWNGYEDAGMVTKMLEK
jgi:hypothetical protein